MIIDGGAGASKVKAVGRVTTVARHACHGWLVALAVAAAVAVPAGAQAGGTPIRVAVLDVELLKADYLPDAHTITEEERHRLDLVAELIRTRLRAEGYDVVPAAATRQAIREAKPLQRLHACNGCERGIARRLAALVRTPRDDARLEAAMRGQGAPGATTEERLGHLARRALVVKRKFQMQTVPGQVASQRVGRPPAYILRQDCAADRRDLLDGGDADEQQRQASKEFHRTPGQRRIQKTTHDQRVGQLQEDIDAEDEQK